LGAKYIAISQKQGAVFSNNPELSGVHRGPSASHRTGTTKDESDIMISGFLKGRALGDDHIGKLLRMSWAAASREVASRRIGTRADQKLYKYSVFLIHNSSFDPDLLSS
jgi:hypothetical protein